MTSILNAEKSIYISMFSVNMLDTFDKNLHVRDLMKLLCKKKQEGIDVKFIFGNSYKHDDQKFFKQLDTSNEMAFTFLRAFGVDVAFFNHYQYESSHSKYVIIDNKEVFIGSHNFSPRSFSVGMDDSIKLNDPVLSNELTSIFMADWKYAYQPNNSEVIDFDRSKIILPEFKYTEPGLPAIQEDYVSKILINENYFEILLDELTNAKQNINISMFYFSFHKEKDSITSKILTVLENKVKNNIKVQFILDRDRPTDIYSSFKANIKRFDELKKIGINVKFDQKELASHAKLIIIDNEKVFIGSHNWTYGSYKKYEETSVLIESKKLAQEYNRIFETRFSELK
jgi:phosphatidylserine/phosphatidylglycerophosphate/cardiolipin synthase-like enzyme